MSRELHGQLGGVPTCVCASLGGQRKSKKAAVAGTAAHLSLHTCTRCNVYVSARTAQQRISHPPATDERQLVSVAQPVRK